MARRALWVDTIFNSSVASAGQVRQSLMGGLSQIDSAGMTVVRTILNVTFLPPVAVSDGYQRVNFGIGVIDQNALAANAVPDPNAQADRPPRGWIIRGQRIILGAAAMVSGTPMFVMEDVRGSRKIDDGELTFIVDNDAQGGSAFTVTAVGLIRCVFLHP